MGGFLNVQLQVGQKARWTEVRMMCSGGGWLAFEERSLNMKKRWTTEVMMRSVLVLYHSRREVSLLILR
jgi:hypothetical protein